MQGSPVEALERKEVLSGVNVVQIDEIDLGSQPMQSIQTGDFNGDDNPDVALATVGSADVVVLWGDGNGSFSGRTIVRTADGEAVVEILTTDMQGDGIDDLIVKSAKSLSVREGNIARSFGLMTQLTVRAAKELPTTAVDFNNDGLTDLVFGSKKKGSTQRILKFMENQGNGEFRKVATKNVKKGKIVGATLDAGDIDRNGSMDVLLFSQNNEIRRFERGSKGGFKTIGKLQGEAYRGAQLIDVDGDTILDIVSQSHSNVVVRLGNGNGGFAAAMRSPWGGTSTTDYFVADVNADGLNDVVSIHQTANSGSPVAYHIGNGDGEFTFVDSVDHDSVTVGALSAVAFGDFNGDGTADFVVAEKASGTMGVFQSQIKVAPDLRVTEFDITPDTVYASNTLRKWPLMERYSPVEITFTVENDGREDAGFFTTAFYLSHDEVIDPSEDYLVHLQRHLLGLNGESSQTFTVTAEFPPMDHPFWDDIGTYHVGAIVDGDNRIAESDETNNADQGRGIDFDSVEVFHTESGQRIQVKRQPGRPQLVGDTHLRYVYQVANIGAHDGLIVHEHDVRLQHSNGWTNFDWTLDFHSGTKPLDAEESFEFAVLVPIDDYMSRLTTESLVVIESNSVRESVITKRLDARRDIELAQPRLELTRSNGLTLQDGTIEFTVTLRNRGRANLRVYLSELRIVDGHNDSTNSAWRLGNESYLDIPAAGFERVTFRMRSDAPEWRIRAYFPSSAFHPDRYVNFKGA